MIRRHNPIGQLIAERIKYKVPELSITVIQSPTNFKSCKDEIEYFLRRLVLQMARHEPKNRLSVEEILTSLRQVIIESRTAGSEILWHCFKCDSQLGNEQLKN